MSSLTRERLREAVTLLREAIKTKTVTYNWHDSDTSFLEAVLARGDRRMGRVGWAVIRSFLEDAGIPIPEEGEGT